MWQLHLFIKYHNSERKKPHTSYAADGMCKSLHRPFAASDVRYSRDWPWGSSLGLVRHYFLHPVQAFLYVSLSINTLNYLMFYMYLSISRYNLKLIL